MENKKSYLSSSFKKIAGLFQKNLFLRNLKKVFYYIDGLLLIFINKPKYKKEKKKNVAIVYNIALGDGVIFRSTVKYLRKMFSKKEYNITLICQNGLNFLYEDIDVFDDIINIDFNKCTINLKERFLSFKLVREKYYDLVIDPVGIFEWTTNIFFTRAICGNEKIGVIDSNLKNYCSMKLINKIYNKIIKVDKKNISLLEYYSIVFNELGDNGYKINVGFEKIPTKKNNCGLPKKYFVVFPCASMQLKRWDLDKYAYIAEKIYNKTKMKLVLIGTKTDEEVLNQFKNKLNIPYIDLINKTNLNDYIDILSNASLVITNDTSSYHIALNQGTPVAIVTGVYTYHRYVLYDFPRKDEFIRPCIVVKKMDCLNCYNRCHLLTSKNVNWPCLESITKEEAWKKIERYINDLKIG